MNKGFVLCLMLVLLSGCTINKNDAIFLEAQEHATTLYNENTQPSALPSQLSMPATIAETETLPTLDYVSLEYYINNSFRPESKNSKTYPSSKIETIALLCIDYYMNSDPFLDENGIPDGLSNIRIYEISDRDDLIVITGDEFFQWPGCFIFTYKNNELVLFPDSAPFEEPIAIAEEIRLVYDTGFPYPMVEIFTYSHKNNGGFGIYKLNGEYLDIITGERVTGYHHTTWDDERKDPIFKDINLDAVEYFDCRYENEHLIPSYEDINGDGYIDIVLSGNFQCEDNGYNVLLSQEVKRTFLYDKEQDKYLFNMDTSIRSPLEEYWCSNVSRKMAEWTEEQNNRE